MIGTQCAGALWFYLFPAYCQRWAWSGYGLLFLVLLGYGNSKYFLLIFPLLYEIIP